MSRVSHILLVVLLCPFSGCHGWDYCQQHWCSGSALEHVACNNNGSLGAQCRREARLLPLSAELQEFIVRQVNLYRNRVASGTFRHFAAADRMASIQWDPELATLAELAVRQCTLDTDKCRNTRRFKHVGQIVGHVIFSAYRFSDRQLIGHKIYNWFKEYKRATEGLVPDDLRGATASFRQLVQERATHMGCGVLRQPRLRWLQQFIVCNFARESVYHEPPYASGHQAAAGCQTGPNPRFPHLCGLEEPYDVNAVDRFATSQNDLIYG